MQTTQRPMREVRGVSPVMSLASTRSPFRITKYCLHDVTGKIVSTRYHIPSCNNEVLQYVEKLVVNGWCAVWINNTCHLVHEEDKVTFQALR